MSTLKTLVNFNITNGNDPVAGLIFDPAADLFGTTATGDTSGQGTVFEIVDTAGTYATSPTPLFATPRAISSGPLTKADRDSGLSSRS